MSGYDSQGLAYTTINPTTLSENQLAAAITALATVSPMQDVKLIEFRVEKLNRAYRRALAVRIGDDPQLENTSSVVVS